MADVRGLALLEAVERLGAIDLAPLLVYRLDSVPEGALFPLAWQLGALGAAGWDLADTVEKRRELLQRTILFHRRKGTAWVVAEVLRALGYPDTVVDEDVGALFCFRVKLGTLADGDGITLERQALLVGTVNEWKNARSWLESLHFRTPEAADETPAPVDEPMPLQRWTHNRYNGVHRYDGSITYRGVHLDALEAI